MPLQFFWKKTLKFVLISLIVTLAIGFLETVRAQSAMDFSTLKKSIPNHQLASVSTPKQLDLKTTATPIVPSSRKLSARPNEGSRAVIGRDDRVPVTSTNYPWSAIGRIVGISAQDEGYQCTGALIGDNVVLTNAHCTIDPKSHLLSKVMAFQPNLINDRLADKNDQAYVTKAYYGTDFRSGRFPEEDDWAILELDRPLGSKYGTLEWNPITTSVLVRNTGNFVLVGYSGDFPENNPGATASAHLQCSIVGEVDGVLTHTCDSMPGSSGGPILGVIDKQVRIIGLNSAYTQNTENQEAVNFAVKISRIIQQIR